MAGYTLNWQDFMRRPEIKVLLEEKGMVAVKQKYYQEQNRLMWQDPMIITENQNAGISVATDNNSYGGSTQFITGHTAEISTFTWQAATPAITASTNFSITAHAIENGTTFVANHQDKRKNVLLAFVSGSGFSATDLSNAGIDVTGADVVVTASSDYVGADASGSWANVMDDAVAGQSATAVVAGFTNTIAPSTLITVATGSAPFNTFTITNVNLGGVGNASSNVATTTGSIATSTEGNDSYHNERGAQLFDGSRLPYANMPRKQ